MNNYKSKPKKAKRNVHYPLNRKSIRTIVVTLLLGITAVGVAVLVLGVPLDLSGDLKMLSIGVLFVLALWFGYQLAFYNKLVIWESGLEIFHNGRHLFILWEDLDRLDWESSFGKKRYWGLYFVRAERHAVGILGIFLGNGSNFAPLQQYADLTYFESPEANEKRLMQSPVIQEILKYAPHLLDDEATRHEKRNALRWARIENSQHGDTGVVDDEAAKIKTQKR